MTLATILACILLPAFLRPTTASMAVFVFRAQQESPAETQPPPASSETTPAQGKDEKAVPETSKPNHVAPKKKRTKAAARKKSAKKHPPSQSNPIVVVRNGGTSDKQGQISSPTSNQQTVAQRKNTSALLNVTNANLEKISGKQLNPNQQEMVTQIRSYMRQSKVADENGDIRGAGNLASKAHLLSEELIKH